MRPAIVLAIVLVSVPAAADKKGDVPQARAHFKAGEAFFNAGIWDRAIDEYQAAYALAPRPQLLFNLGAAYRRKSETTHAAADLRAAVEHYRKYLEAEPAGQGAPDARGFLASLSRDLSEAERIEAANPHPPPSEPPPPEPLPTPPIARAVPAPPVDAEPPPRVHSRGWRVAGVTSAAVGLALVGTGVVFGLQARSASDELQGLGPDDMWSVSRYDAGRRDQRIMAGLLAGGGVAVVGGAVMYFVLGRDRRGERRDVTVIPTAGGAAIVVTSPF